MSECENGTDLEVHALLALHNANELTGHHPALVNELVEAVLPIGARLPKVDLARFSACSTAVCAARQCAMDPQHRHRPMQGMHDRHQDMAELQQSCEAEYR